MKKESDLLKGIVIPKRLSRDQKIVWFWEQIIDYQLAFIGTNKKELLEKGLIFPMSKQWMENPVNQITEEQYSKLYSFAIALMQRLFKWNKLVCSRNWSLASLNYTLIIKKE